MMVCLTRFKFSVLLVAFFGCLCHGAETLLWELPAGAKPAELTGKAAWTKAAAGSASANGLALENSLLVFCAKPGDAGLVLHGKGDPVDSAACSELLCLDQGGQPVTVKIVKSSAANDGIQLEVGLSNGGVLTVLLTPDASSVKFSFDAKIKTLRIRAPMPLIFRPDFFDSSMIYHTSLSTFAQGASYVPVDNYVFGLLNANAAIGCAWNSKNVKVQLTPSTTFVAPAAPTPVAPATPAPAAAPAPVAPVTPAAPGTPAPAAAAPLVTAAIIDKPFESLQLTLDPADSVLFVGILKSPQAFLYRNFSGLTLDKEADKNKYAEVAMPWTAPYLARWTTVILHGEQLNTVPSCIPVTRMWRLRALKSVAGHERETSESTEFLWDKSDVHESDKRLWRPQVQRGATYNGKDVLTWKVEQRFLPYTVGVVFPSGRETTTPSEVVTIVDFVREALGEKALDDVLDVPGLKDRREIEGHPTPQASCAAMSSVRNIVQKLDAKPDDPKAAEIKADILNQVQGIQWYFQLVTGRAREYLDNTDKLEKYAAEHASDSPNCAPLAAVIKVACTEIKKEWVIEDTCNGAKETLTCKWQDDFWDKTLATLKEWKFPLIGLIYRQQNIQINRGDALDSFVNKASKGMKRAIWAAYLMGGKDDASLTMAQNVIRMCHQYIRCRHWMEDKVYIERCGRNPPRLPAKK